MEAAMVDPLHGNEWLGLLMDWELAESSCSLQNEGSSTLTYEGGASDYECTNTGSGPHTSTSCERTHNSAPLSNIHSSQTHNITITTTSPPIHATLLEAKEENTLSNIQHCCAFPFNNTSTSPTPHNPPLKVALETPNYILDAKSQAFKDTSSSSYFNSHAISVGASYNKMSKGLDIKEERIWLHEAHMMGSNACGHQEYVRGNGGNEMLMRPLTTSAKSKGTTTYVLSRSEASANVLEQANERSKASHDYVQWGQQLSKKKDANLLHLISEMHQEDKEPSPWLSFDHLSKWNVSHASYKNMITSTSPRPHCGKKMTTSALPPSTHPNVRPLCQQSKSLTLSFNQHNKTTSKRPHNYLNDDGEGHNYNSLGLFFGNTSCDLIKESEVDDMSGTTRDDDEESFALMANAYTIRKKAKVEDDSSARHCLAERKRREKLNKKFDELRAIVGPSLSVKTDKASIIGAAIKLLIDKKGSQSSVEPKVSTSNNIKQEVVDMNKESGNFSSHILFKGDKAKLLDGSSQSLQVDLRPHKEKPHDELSEVFCDLEVDFKLDTMGSSSRDSLLHDVKVYAKQDSPQGRHYIINVRAPKMANIFSDIIATLSKLDLQVIFANSCFSNNSTLSITPSIRSLLLLKVEAIAKSSTSTSDHDKCEIIHNAIKGCFLEAQEKKARDLRAEGQGQGQGLGS